MGERRQGESGIRCFAPAVLSLALAILVAPSIAHADPLVVALGSDAHPLITHLDVVLDPSGELTAEQVARREIHTSSDGSAGSWPGETHPTAWMRATLEVEGGAEQRDWYLVIGPPYSPGTVFVEEAPGRYRAVPLTLDPRGISFKARLPLRAGAQSLLLRGPWPAARPSLLHVATLPGIEQLSQHLLTTQGLYLGVLAVMILVNLLLGVILRDAVYLWYVGFTSVSATFFALMMGTVSRFVLPLAPATSLFRPQTACLALLVISGIQFSRRFLDTRDTAPRFDLVMRGYLGLAALVLALVAVGPDLLALRGTALLGVLVPFVTLGAGIAAWRAGSRWARFYLAGWSLFTLGGFVFALPFELHGIDRATVFQLSSAAEAILFAVALVDRMRILRSDRVQVEDALERSERRFRSIFDGAVEATWLLDEDARVLEINDTANSTWPTNDEARRRPLRELAPWNATPIASARLAEAIARVRAGEQARFEASFAEHAAMRWCDVTAKSIGDGLVLIEARDITELKQAELNMIRAEKLAALGQLVAGVAHEVNNPNNFLTFNLPILKEYLDALRPHVEARDRETGSVRLYGMTVDEFYADAAALIGNMQHGTERITNIVSELRSYARQNDEAQWENADANRVVENAATLVRTQLREWVDTFELDLADGLSRVRMNTGRIEQVVINLVLNAAHAAAQTSGGRVDVHTSQSDGHVVIAVEDNGPGVPPEVRDRIFEPFFTTKAREQGTGMGLAISQRIVDEHGGTLELASGPGPGARFVVTLPIASEAS